MEAVLDRYIELTPQVRGGRPHIVDTRTAVDGIVLIHLRLGQSMKEIAGMKEKPFSRDWKSLADSTKAPQGLPERVPSG